MALYKEIRQHDGVITKYHRISYITATVNRQNSIAVLSYVDSESRDNEKTDLETLPYRKAVTYETEYSPSMTVELAYEYLKTLPEFAGATDI